MNVIQDVRVSSEAFEIQEGLRSAVAKALERKRRLGQYWVVWDGEKPVKVNAENDPLAAE